MIKSPPKTMHIQYGKTGTPMKTVEVKFRCDPQYGRAWGGHKGSGFQIKDPMTKQWVNLWERKSGSFYVILGGDHTDVTVTYKEETDENLSVL